MSQVSKTPNPTASGLTSGISSPADVPCTCQGFTLAGTCISGGLSRNGGLPSTVPAAFSKCAPSKSIPHLSVAPRSDVPLKQNGSKRKSQKAKTTLAKLRRKIASIERVPISLADKARAKVSHTTAAKAFWTSGAKEIDARLCIEGLGIAGVHEIKPRQPQSGTTAIADQAAAVGFALHLLTRLRLARLQAEQDKVACLPVLWCWSQAMRRDFGGLYGPGLAALGFDARDLLIVETAHARDALWAIEEGLKSGALAAVIGFREDVGLTPSRRLSLAAGKMQTPCLMMTSARAPQMAATASRWRIGSGAGFSPQIKKPRNNFDEAEPIDEIQSRYSVALERCRGQMIALDALPVTLEWSHETHAFRVAAGLGNRSASAPQFAFCATA